MSIVHSYEQSKLIDREINPIKTVYDRYMLEKHVVDRWWIEMCSNDPVQVKNEKE